MGKKIYVGNLNWNTTEDTLRDTFTGSDRSVEDVAIITDRDTGRSRGFAFVTMATPQQARDAIDELDGLILDGRDLRVDAAQDRRSGDRY